MGRAVTCSCAALLAALATAMPARGALPPAYGGALRWPAPHAVSSPNPASPRSPFEAALARAVYGGLYAIADGGAVVPELAESMPEVVEGGHRIRLRGGIVRHDGRPLEAVDALRSLERSFAAEASGFLLAPLAGSDGRLAATLDAEGGIVVRASLTSEELAMRLAALPCAIVPAPTRSGRSRGTGAFRSVPTGEGIELRGFRDATPAAPYLETITAVGPRAPERELRDLELGRLHASWFGASLYGTPTRPTDTLELSRTGIVLVVGRGPARGALAWLGAHVDRERLRRANVLPAESVSPELRAPSFGRAAKPRSIAIHVRSDDAFAAAVARELSAQGDALGVTVSVTEPPPLGAPESQPTLRIVTVVPPLPGAAAALGATFAAAGQRDRARAIGLDLDRARDQAPRLSAVVLGLRRDVLFHRRGVSGLRRDGYGLPVLAELHLRRRSEIEAEAGGAAP